MSDNVIKFKYVFSDDYEPDYINGAFGGVIPSGELVINFFADRPSIPYEEQFSINDDGTLGDGSEVTAPEEFKMRRSVKSGVIMSRDTAEGIYWWLKGQLTEMGVDEDDL